MARPSKSAEVLESEKKSHRTRSELAGRKTAGQSLLTGKPLKERPEVKQNAAAHREFSRVNGLLKAVARNDALYESIINRYCLLAAECIDMLEIQAEFRASREELREEYLSGETDREDLTPSKYYKLLSTMQSNILAVDKQIHQKRQMMLAIEKECAMTISAAERSIPKSVEPKNNPLLEALMGDDENEK